VRCLREHAAKSAACCADCFTPLAATASVTMIRRRVVTARGEAWLRVPICLICWLVHLECKTESSRALLRLRGRADHNQFAFELNGPLGQLVRFRCGGCGRPIRSLGLPVRSRRVCCADCARKVNNEYYRLRRRVRHQERACAVCGVPFLPTRNDAVTCSNSCRQKLHRQRHSAQTAKRRSNVQD
jgi:hypothetical protein